MEYMILKELPMQLLKLLIIDEVHLLSEERGAVIEAIVARTLRQVHLIGAGAWTHSLTSFPFSGRIKSICYPYRGPECHASELH